MVSTDKPGQVVFTNKARCRDCYRCVRVCPVKAIRMKEGQAFVVDDLCISCGTCIRECPQGAKTFRQDLERARQLMAEKAGPIAASVAPAFAAVFSEWERLRLPSALRKLGFTFVAETAVGAFEVARRTAELATQQGNESRIMTACPAVVRYVEMYRPNLVDRLLPVVSPMIAHARHLKTRLGSEAQVVFIGPCVAKKQEAARPELAGTVDCVLTFPELREWLKGAGIELARCEESNFDEQPAGAARLFPLAGGAAHTGGLETDVLSPRLITVTGVEDLGDVLDTLPEPSSGPFLLEPLFCRQGCINGPALAGESSPIFARRQQLNAFAASHPANGPRLDLPDDQLATCFEGQPRWKNEVPETEIRRVLSLTGKTSPEDELNCGACGYASCRDKAIAVVRGMAEVEMCIPYMRRLAEQRRDRIIETSPNGIVIVDEHLTILNMNPAFRRFFMCSDAVCGKPISYLMDPEPFEQVAAARVEKLETVVEHGKYGLTCHEIIYSLPEDRQVVGIFINITNSRDSQQKLDAMRAQTVRQAQDLLNHQITMAQTMAKFLGESTAHGEKLVDNLRRIAKDVPSPRTR
jgi:iron only hydrogenase large subunit-like protein/uncharacterized Fe-S cluster-containing protein